jgi:hypothetical protein
MKARTTILKQWHSTGDGDGFPLFITDHDEGAGDVYRSETLSHDMIIWGTLEAVKHETADWLKNDRKHQCSEECTEWVPI